MTSNLCHLNAKCVSVEQYTPAQRARETVKVKLLCKKKPDWIFDIQTAHTSAVDYQIWTTIEERAYRTDTQSVDELKQRLIQVWFSLHQDIIDMAIGRWFRILRACIRPKGHTIQAYRLNSDRV